MAQFYNLVTNPNGTYTIEDIQQICSIDGQSVQLVVEDINNGANVISQPLLAYPASPDNTDQTVFSPQTINIGPHLTTTPLESRPSVYIIKTNDPPIQQTIYNKVDAGNSRIQGDNKGSKDQFNICYTQSQSDWPQENNETFELVIKKDPSPVKTLTANAVRNQQQITTNLQTSSPNIVIPGESQRKVTRIIPLNKRNSTGAPVGILKNTLQGTNIQAVGRGAVGKMKRNSNLSNTPNVSLPTRSRASTGGVSTSPLLINPPRTPQARPSIHSDQQRNLLPKNAPNLQTPEMGHLSERIRQATLKQRQQSNEQRQKQQPVMAVNPMPRTVQSPQAPVQRQRAMGQLVSVNRQQQQLQLQQQQQQQQQQLLQQQQQLQQQHLQHQLRQRAVVVEANLPAQAHTVTVNVDEPMEVDSSENVVQLERLNQQNCTAKTETEENSSESLAYLQQEIDDPHTAIVQQQITGNEAKMLVILENGEQRLITFEVPKEDCTVQDLLEQVTASIFSTHEPCVSLVSDPALGINYIVDVTAKSNHEEEHVESIPSEPSNVTSTVEPKSLVKINNVPTTVQAPMGPRVPKYIKGMLAVCSFCGMSAADFNYCMRCKRKLPENVKSIPISSGISSKKESGVPIDSFYKKADSNLTQKPEREAVSKRGRGRGRGTARTRQVKEPECLTISSDEEDDNRKKRLADSKEMSNSLNSTNSEEADTILEKEPVITNSTVAPPPVPAMNNQNLTSGGRETVVDAAMNHLSTYLICRTVRIGSYKYIPSDKILVSSSGLKLEVPLLEDEKSSVTVDIKLCNLVKVLIHFAKSMPVLFFYTDVTTGEKIRDILGMQDPKGPYFDPASKDHTHKRITLLPEKILDESKNVLKELYRPIYEELNAKEANDILVKASPKAKTQVQTSVKKPTASSSSNSSNSNGIIQTITVYPPPPAKGGIAINTEDFICLAEDQFLNDVIIDFYLKYLTLEVLSEADHNRTHVFSSYFYKRLTSPHAQAAESSENLSAAAKRHARVQKWTKNVNIFEKDFVVIPINEHAHWFLAIICFPGLVGKVQPKVEIKPENEKIQKKKKEMKLQTVTIGNTTITPVSTITIDPNDDGSERDEAEGDEEEMETDSDEDEDSDSKAEDTEQVENQLPEQPNTDKEIVKVPCILIFDSLAGASRARVVATLRDYLSCEHQAKIGREQIFSRDTIKGACPKVPQQSNFTDCGLYVLQYVESFFKTPIIDYTLPIKTLKNWFEEITVTRKREELAKLLTKLVNNTKGDKTINLPILTFPTFDGKLKQTRSDSQETKPSKTDTENKKKATDTGENKSNTVTSTTENVESNSESPSKNVTSQITIPQTSNQCSNTTDGNLIVQKEATTAVTTKSSAETMAFLKTKRIPRLQKSSDNQEDKQVAKKHKGDSFDSCK